MDNQISQQLLAGVLVLTLGASGWLLPYRWNLLRLRRGLDRLLPEQWNQAVPKLMGALLIVVGISVLVGTALAGRFQ